ncbi:MULTISPECIES: PhzF family phenazine biosynthesis protein [unclassified Streptomyces]|uniref:PhzF family phenazine biosynthesis protein n=1 Tax=unclassified Streptomyces TaxID=2593676 RepID=UPI0007496299|nr:MULTISPECIES: PhzF family phenazine biosynthesis protein [unclassified Streptomyces]KUL75442.1 phenazine biosynthesis protein PhzF [Streptomyces sp. NRRL WC-3605]KUL76049.1 phenazine biosynthesis protein PhzF [Streptomyces sp. NRRL WC-3604]
MRFLHVNVFSDVPYGGNSLAVFPDATGLDPAQMLRITQELRHFESVFLLPWNADAGPGFQARVFDLSEELDFAGHPVIGAAAVLHHLAGMGGPVDWKLELKARTVRVKVRQNGKSYEGVLDQGPASFLGEPEIEGLSSWFDLEVQDLHPGLRPQVVSTGLRYLIVPVRPGLLHRARIRFDLTEPLRQVGAQFAYLLDADELEGRHWNNDGILEDVATGSAAGCVAAYLRRHGRLVAGETVTLRQGRHMGRPSSMSIGAYDIGPQRHGVTVGGHVSLVAEGHLMELPR